jgi:uncharacterized membrane protein YkoI
MREGMRELRIAAFALCATSACGAGHATPHHAKVPIEDARAVALRTVPGRIVAEELEEENGRWIYSFEIRNEGERGRIHEVNVDADRGTVVGPVEIESEENEE